MMQTLAIFLDAYRELNARKMFWVTLVLSGLVVSVLFMVGINDPSTSGGGAGEFSLPTFRFLFWDTTLPVPPGITLDMLLKSIFVSLGIGFWLTWAATILALVSTASIFPDFLSNGSIDLVLAKPISRLRLFLTKYVGGLLFVTLQVSVFSVLAMAIIGFRTGSWEPGILLAIPIVVLFFSYLFAMCTFVGTITRSTIASLLVTIIFWLMLFGFNLTDEMLAVPRVAREIYVEKLEEKIEKLENDKNTPNAQSQLVTLHEELDEATQSAQLFKRWHGVIYSAKTILPKTSETIGLLERWLVEAANLPDTPDSNDEPNPFITPEMHRAGVNMNSVVNRVQTIYRDRSVFWVIGTSLIFEIVLLALCAWIFIRRDF